MHFLKLCKFKYLHNDLFLAFNLLNCFPKFLHESVPASKSMIIPLYHGSLILDWVKHIAIVSFHLSYFCFEVFCPNSLHKEHPGYVGRVKYRFH